MSDDALENRIVRACRRRQADWAHARRTAALADRLARDTRHVHGLTKTYRPLVQAAALLHDLAAPEGPRRDHHLRAARAILRLRVKGLGAWEKRVVAGAVRLHRRGPDVARAAEAGQAGDCETRIATRIAAVLRVADGLDHSRTKMAEILAIDDDGRTVTVLTSPRTAAEDIACANTKANLWNAVLARPLQVARAPGGELPDAATLKPPDTLAEAVARILRRQREQLASREYGLGCGRDVEFVHEMRVATRRMRSALHILGESASPRAKRLGKELKWLAGALGAVRDCDVFLEFLRGQSKRLADQAGEGLSRLIAAQRRRRLACYRALLAAFESSRYRAIGEELQDAGAAVLAGAGRRASRALWREAPKVLARAYEDVRGHRRRLDKMDAKRQHQLRIDCKRLRYDAEFFADVYDDGLGKVIRAMVALQDLLGDAHDAVVWRKSLRANGANQPALKELEKVFRRRRAECLRRAQAAWAALQGVRARRQIASAIASPRRP